MDSENTKDCDICLSALPIQSTLTWDCNQCTWCFECISSGITASPQKSDWPQNWCGHDHPTPIALKSILEKSKKHIPANVYTKWFEKQEQWSQVKCPHCCRWTHSDHITEGRVLECPTCNKSVCIECGKLAHGGQCRRTRKEDLKAVLTALRHEGAAMCPRCGFVAGRAQDGCNQITCPKPCSQVFCFKCSRDWKLCRGLCKGGGAAEVLEKATQVDSPTEVYHVSGVSGAQASTAKEESKDDEAFADSDEDKKTKVDGKKKKRAHSSDPLFERFSKKAKTRVEDEEDKEDLEVDSDASDDEEDKVAHDDDNVDFEFDIDGDDEYGSDDGEDEEEEEEEEDGE